MGLEGVIMVEAEEEDEGILIITGNGGMEVSIFSILYEGLMLGL